MTKFAYLFFISFYIFAVTASASYISMATSFSFKEKEGGGHMLQISSQNKGDESAHQVQHKARVGGQEFISSATPRLGVNETTEAAFSLPSQFRYPGNYPVFITTFYQDANGYKFSALSVGFYEYQTPVRSEIYMKGEEVKIPVNGKQKLKFTIRNNDSTAHQLTLSLHIPEELMAEEEAAAVSVDPKSEKTLSFVIKNFSALENSNYAVFLVAEYDHDGKHYSSSASTIARITAPKSIFSVPPKYVIPVIVVLIIGFLLLQFRRKNKRTKADG